MRDAYMSGHVVCENCGARTAAECHHIASIEDAPHLRLEESNLMALCRHCHRLIHDGR